jgi:AcrR family transcriptional regulator
MRKFPAQERSRFTVDAIVEATIQLMGTDGYGAISTNQVAERAGVSIGSLYQYFSNKPSLAGAVCVHLRRQQVEVMESRVEEAEADPDLAPALISDALMMPWDQDAELSRQLLELPVELQIWRKCSTHIQETVAVLERYLGGATQQDSAGIAAWSLFTAGDAIARIGVLEQPDELDSGAVAVEVEFLVRAWLGR